MFSIHIFDSSEDHYDCVCGGTPSVTLMFQTEEQASLYLREEFNTVYYSTPEQLANDRADHAEYIAG